MIKEVKKVKIDELQKQEKEYKNEILEIREKQKDFQRRIEYFEKEKDKLQKDAVRMEHNILYKIIPSFKRERAEVLRDINRNNEYIQGINEEIYKLSNQINQINVVRENGKKEIEKIFSAETLKDMGISFEDAAEALKKNNIPIVLSEEDRKITKNESDFEQVSDLMFVHKTAYFPQDGIIRTGKDAGATGYKTSEIDGNQYKVGVKSGRETLHFTLNTEVEWHAAGGDWQDMEYTILIPGSQINEEQLLALRGEDSYFKGNIQLPEGAYILVPENKREQLQKENPELQLIGYEGTPKDYGTALLSTMGYKAERFQKEGWMDNEDQEKVYKLAETIGKSTAEHCYSKEISEETRRENISYLVNVFKIIKKRMEENPNFINQLDDNTLPLNSIRQAFVGPIIKGEYDCLNKNVCETEGIDELISIFKEEGFLFNESYEKMMKETYTREKFSEYSSTYGLDTGKVITKDFVIQMMSNIEITKEQEKNIKEDNNPQKSTENTNEKQDIEVSSTNQLDILVSAIEATEETKVGTIIEKRDEIANEIQNDKTKSIENNGLEK